MFHKLNLTGTSGERFVVECDEQTVYALNGKPCKFVKEGVRLIYKCGSYVIKLDERDEQNFQEFHTFTSMDQSMRKHFAEVLAYAEVEGEAYLFSVLIQRFVKGRKTNERIFVDMAQSVGRQFGITDIGGFHNFVVVEDEEGCSHPVIYDLGM